MTRMLTARHARAIREDAVAAPMAETARLRIGVRSIYIGPHRCRIRIGEEPVRVPSHMPLEELRRSNELRKVYLARRPRCRACGALIYHGERAITFAWVSESGGSSTDAFIHETCPDPERSTTA